MKKIITIALVLVFALTLSVGAFAIADGEGLARIDIEAISADLNDDPAATISELVDLATQAMGGPEAFLAWVQDFFGDLEDFDLYAEVPADVIEAARESFLAGVPVGADGGVIDQVASEMSGGFVSFIAGLYVPICETITTTTSAAAPTTATTTAAPTTTVAATGTVPPTGDQNAIAIGAFAVVAVAAAAAFVCLKKKEK